MKLLTRLAALFEKEEQKTPADHKREALVEVSAQQFTKLRELGLGVPVGIDRQQKKSIAFVTQNISSGTKSNALRVNDI